MTIDWKFAGDDPRAPYLQIADDLRQAIQVGELAPGARLPSQHDLSARYGVARMTVQGALRELRQEGLIYSRQGQGVFVRDALQDGDEVLAMYMSKSLREPGATDIAYYGPTPDVAVRSLHEAISGSSRRPAVEEVRLRVLAPEGADGPAEEDLPYRLESRELETATDLQLCLVGEDWMLMQFPFDSAPSDAELARWNPLSAFSTDMSQRSRRAARAWFNALWADASARP